MYLDGDECVICPPDELYMCAECSNWNECTVCKSGTYLYDGYCYDCNDYNYGWSNCATCNYDDCLTCQAGYFVSGGSCYACDVGC